MLYGMLYWCKLSVWLVIVVDIDLLLFRVICRMIFCLLYFVGNMCLNEYLEVVLEMVN